MSASWLAAPYSRFVAALDASRLGHAWLIGGPAGLGKRKLAERIASVVLCQDRSPGGDACDQCRGCHLLRAGTHPDLYRIGLELNDRGTPRSEIVIEQVRSLGERLAQSSHSGGRRIALVDPADALNTSSANALLKTLEEPPASVVILLVADQPSRLLATVRSRCQRLDVRMPAGEQVLEWMLDQRIDRDLAIRSVELAAGNPGEALSIARSERVLEGVLEDLLAMTTGAGSAGEIARRWCSDAHLGARLDIALHLIRISMRTLAGGVDPADVRMRRLTGHLEVEQLSRSFDDLGRLQSQLSAPLRHELLLVEWLRRWMPQSGVSSKVRASR